MRKAPAHAGSLSPWERLAFALAFALMAGFVVVVTVSAAREHQRSSRQAAAARPAASAARGAPATSAAGGRSRAASASVSPGPGPGSMPGSIAGSPGAAGGSPSSAGGQQAFAQASNRQLAVALAPVVLHRSGDIAVGVIDRTTGVSAVYNSRHRFHTASIVKADILATVLLQHQQAGSTLDPDEQALAGQMIEDSDNDAATSLWYEAGGNAGIAQANKVLGLRHTRLGSDGSWGLTSTTISDQLMLLTDLTSSSSPLSAAARSFELGMMRHVTAGQAWGVTAAAAAHTSPAVKNGWVRDPALWVINSIGVVRDNGQEVLVAVLSSHQQTESAGISQVETAAMAAVDAITAARS